MNEIRKQERTVDTVTAEIQLIRAQVKKVFYDAVIQIGTRLLEVKELVPHGEWTSYLENRLGYKPSTAQNYMRIAKEFGDGQVSLDGTDPQTLFGQLGYAQLLPLLSLPDEDRRTLAQENDLEAMSSREIDELVRARKAAEEELAQSKAAEKEARELVEQIQGKLKKAEKNKENAKDNERNALAAMRMAEQRADKLQEEHTFLQNQVKALTEQAEQTPLTAEVVPSEAELAQARQEVREEMQEALKQAEEKARQAEARLKKAKNPAAMRVNLLFEDIQEQMDKLFSALAALQTEQPDVADKFRAAIRQYLREGLQWQIPELAAQTLS